MILENKIAGFRASTKITSLKNLHVYGMLNKNTCMGYKKVQGQEKSATKNSDIK